MALRSTVGLLTLMAASRTALIPLSLIVSFCRCLIRKRADPDFMRRATQRDIHCKNVRSANGIGALFKRRRWRG